MSLGEEAYEWIQLIFCQSLEQYILLGKFQAYSQPSLCKRECNFKYMLNHLKINFTAQHLENIIAHVSIQNVYNLGMLYRLPEYSSVDSTGQL